MPVSFVTWQRGNDNWEDDSIGTDGETRKVKGVKGKLETSSERNSNETHQDELMGR